MVIPGDVWLTQFQGTLSSAVTGATTTGPAGAAAAAGSNIVGNLQFQGGTLDHPSVALWLTRLEQVHGWVNAWVSSSTKSNGSVTFSGTADMTVDVTTGGRQ